MMGCDTGGRYTLTNHFYLPTDASNIQASIVAVRFNDNRPVMRLNGAEVYSRLSYHGDAVGVQELGSPFLPQAISVQNLRPGTNDFYAEVTNKDFSPSNCPHNNYGADLKLRGTFDTRARCDLATTNFKVTAINPPAASDR